MTNIFTFELKRLLGRLSTYIYLALILVCEGYFIANINLYGASPAIEYTLEILSLPLMLCLPLLTFSSFARDNASGFDSVIFSLGLSNTRLILGKFTAIFTIFAISTLPVIIMPFILSALANVNLLSAFSGIVGYILFGTVMISVGVFVSIITPKPLYSALITYATVGVIYLCEWLALYSLNTTLVLFSLTILSLLLSLAFMKVTKSDYAWLIPLAVLEVMLLVLRFAFPKGLTALGRVIFTFIGARSSVSGFCYGLLDISSALSLLLLGALMLTLGIIALSSKKHIRSR